MRYLNKLLPPARQEQHGLVSIMVVSVIIVVLALITIGFSKIMDRELRQSLDRELSSQAYYAAEAGLNDARAYVTAVNAGTAPAPPANDKCLDTSGLSQFAQNGDVSGNNIAKYTCVIINMAPKELIYSPIPAGKTRVFKTDAAGLKYLYFSWENSHYFNPTGAGPQPLGSTCGATNCDLPEESAVGQDATGVLRATIYPVYGGGAATYGANPNTKLAADSRTYFLYPNGGSGNAPGTADYLIDNGVFVQGNCNDANHPPLPFNQATQRYCNGEITNLPQITAGGAQAYYVSLTAMYKDLSVSIQGSDTGTANSGGLNLPGAEATADVTGEGNDVLRRISARIPFNSSFAYPGDGLSSMETICKRFRLPKIGPGPTDYAEPGPQDIDDPSGSSFCPLTTTTGPSLDIVYWALTHPVFGNKYPTLVISVNGKIVYQSPPSGGSGGGNCTSISGVPNSINRFDAASVCKAGNILIPLASVSGPVHQLEIWETNGQAKRLGPDAGCQISLCAYSRIFITNFVSPPSIILVNKSQKPNSIAPPFGPPQCTQYPPGSFTKAPYVLSDPSAPVILDNYYDPGVAPCSP